MGKFVTPLDVENIDDLTNEGRGIWKVMLPFIFQSDVLKTTISVERGFLTDFASVPRAPFIYWLVGDTSHKAAVIHDWLFHNHNVCDESTANRVLLEAMETEGIPWWRRKLIYWGVQIGGESPWEEDGKGNGHTVVDGRIV